MWPARVVSKILPPTLSFAVGLVLFAQQPDPALEQAKSDFAHGRTAEADVRVDAVLKDHPADLRGLILKGAILDSQQRYKDAASYYERALKIAPNSAQVLNNAANHYLASGDHDRARKFYLRTTAIDPHHANANLQLAQMSVDDKQGGEALSYLSRLPDSSSTDIATLLLRARALALAGQCTDAVQLLEKIEGQTSAGPSLYFSEGMTFAQCKLYEQAESAFSRVLDTEPTNFDVLYNLGLASLEAGHVESAIDGLEAALRQRPVDADCLYALAEAYVKQQRFVDAAALLAKAQTVASHRAEVILLLAQVSARLEFFKDAAAKYDEYLRLKPDDGPWQNGIAERWVGSYRREMLDHVIPLNEEHLWRLGRDYLRYYHEDRTHNGLAKQTPGSRPTQFRPGPKSEVVALPRIGGLHHRYVWSDAA